MQVKCQLTLERVHEGSYVISITDRGGVKAKLIGVKLNLTRKYCFFRSKSIATVLYCLYVKWRGVTINGV